MTASTVAEIDGLLVSPHVARISEFLEALAADWRGWDGIRRWTSIGRKLAIDAEHDGGGHVALGVTLRAPWLDLDDTAWSARAVFTLEAGEEMSRLAAGLAHFLRT